MKLFVALFLITLSTCNCFSQNIGENSEIVLYLIEQNFNNRRIKDILKHGELQYTYNVVYGENNEIRKIIVDQKNEVFLDLEAQSDTKFHYLFYEGKLIEVQTDFLDLSYDYVLDKFDEKYGKRCHGYNMYFTANYKQMRYIYDNGKYASILFSDYLPSNSETLEFQKLIKKKQEEYAKDKD